MQPSDFSHRASAGSEPIAARDKGIQDLKRRSRALLRSGQFREALACCDQIVRLAPSDPTVFQMRGLAFDRLGRFDDALASFDRAIELAPRDVGALIYRGLILFRLKRYDAALDTCEQALALDPGNYRLHNNKGVTLTKLKRFEAAVAGLDQAIALKPDFAEAFNNRGHALDMLNRHEDAVSSLKRAIALKPDYAEAFNHLGTSLIALGRPAEGLQSFDRAIAISPDYTDPYLSRGKALVELKRLDDAMASYSRLLAIKPGWADALMNRASVNLLCGRMIDGWRDYESRWQASTFTSEWPTLKAPHWHGEDLSGRSIVLFTEQGFGDTIHFVRYIRILVDRGAAVTLVAPLKLQRLLRGLDAKVDIGATKDQTFDFQCPLMSLPFRLGTTERSVPNNVPYLKPEPERASRWNQALGDHGFKIGIAWQGSTSHAGDRGRSIPLSEYVRLGRLPRVRLISLQKNDGVEQLRTLPSDVTVETLGPEFDGGPDAFVDSAALMSHLDLVITSDTSIAHLSGALARPTWLALRHVPEWRWQLDREDSPWYPTMRLFRQETAGDWTTVFANIEREVRRLSS